VTGTRIDPITAQVIRSGLETVALEMRTAIMRTAYSPIVAMGGDLSVSIGDRNGRLVAQGKDIPAQLGAMPYSFALMLEPWRDRLGPGDVVVGNDPYLGGSNHVNDVCMIMGAFDGDEHLGYVATRVHWTDIGGGTPGSFNTQVADMYGEGLRIPPVRLYRDYEPVQEIWDLILANVRGAGEREWDARAGFAGCVVGERGLTRLAQRHGRQRLRMAMAEAIDYSERRLRGRIAGVPDGEYGAQDWIEGDGWVHQPIRLQVAIRVQGDGIEVDWTGTDSQVRGGVNLSLPTTSGIGVYATRAVLDPGVPANAGMFAPVVTIAPEGTLVNPRPPAPSQTGVSETGQRAADLLMMAFAQAVPERVIAGTYASAAMTIIEGPDLVEWRRRALRRDRSTTMELAPGGMGARATKDGISGIKVHTGNTRTQPVEIVEFVSPVRMLHWRRVPDTGGAGTWRGGCAAEKEFRVLADGVNFTSVVERTAIIPFGLYGGRPGAPGRLARNPGAQEQLLPSKHPPVRLSKCERFLLRPAGSGGFGPPWKRPAERVLADVLDGYVTIEGAQRDYGVVIGADGTVDEAATATARVRLAAEPRPGAEPAWDRGQWTYGGLSWPPSDPGPGYGPGARLPTQTEPGHDHGSGDER
jgi:N-methylhydantoinase B